MAVDENCVSAEALLRSRTLGRSDWINAALDTLIGKGIDAVKITQLAQKLGVTRGSFYWHFKAREDILSALISYWRKKNTTALVNAAARGPDLEDAVLALMEVWLDSQHFDQKLDLAVRSWSRTDRSLKQTVQENDEARLYAITKMYKNAGRDHADAVVAARNIYYVQMGYFACEIEEPLDVRLSYLQAYVQSYTGEPLSRERAEAFIKTIKTRLASNERPLS